jgi:hypothetical protein
VLVYQSPERPGYATNLNEAPASRAQVTMSRMLTITMDLSALPAESADARTKALADQLPARAGAGRRRDLETRQSNPVSQAQPIVWYRDTSDGVAGEKSSEPNSGGDWQETSGQWQVWGMRDWEDGSGAKQSQVPLELYAAKELARAWQIAHGRANAARVRTLWLPGLDRSDAMRRLKGQGATHPPSASPLLGWAWR